MSRISVGLSRCWVVGLLVLAAGCPCINESVRPPAPPTPAARKASEVRRADLFPQGGDRVVVFLEALQDGRERASVVDARLGQVTHVIEDRSRLVDQLVMPEAPLELAGMGCVAGLPPEKVAEVPIPKPESGGTTQCSFGQSWNSVTQQCEAATPLDPNSLALPGSGSGGPTPGGGDPMLLRVYADVLSARTLQSGLRGPLACDAPGARQSLVMKRF